MYIEISGMRKEWHSIGHPPTYRTSAHCKGGTSELDDFISSSCFAFLLGLIIEERIACLGDELLKEKKNNHTSLFQDTVLWLQLMINYSHSYCWENIVVLSYYMVYHCVNEEKEWIHTHRDLEAELYLVQDEFPVLWCKET